MRKSIKKMVMIRVIATLAAVLLLSAITAVNISRIRTTQAENAAASALLDRIEKAEVAHYKWVTNLSNALYAGKEFTGSIDPTTCVLGQWLYGETNSENDAILSLRSQMEPLHKELHQSATYVLDLHAADPLAAQEYYQNTIQTNLTTLVGLMDQVVTESTQMSEDCGVQIEKTIRSMQILSACLHCFAY